MTPKFNQTYHTILESTPVSTEIRRKNIQKKIKQIKQINNELETRWSQQQELMEQTDDAVEMVSIKREIKKIELKYNNLQSVLTSLEDQTTVNNIIHLPQQEYYRYMARVQDTIIGSQTSNYVATPETLKKRRDYILNRGERVRNSPKVKPTGKKTPWTIEEKYKLYTRYVELMKQFPNKNVDEIFVILADEFKRSYSSISMAIHRLKNKEKNNESIY